MDTASSGVCGMVPCRRTALDLASDTRACEFREHPSQAWGLYINNTSCGPARIRYIYVFYHSKKTC